MKMKNTLLITLSILIVLTLIILGVIFKDKLRVSKLEKPISCLSYNDLVQLSITPNPQGDLLSKLQKQLVNPYIVNIDKGNRLHVSPHLRVAHWNIQRGININQIKNIFLNPSSFYYNYRKNIDEKNWGKFKKELDDFTKSSIISLNEVDIGIPRTSYKNIALELANTLGYNLTFSTEFIELSPIIYKQAINPKKYLGLHGNAILSKYPILNARILRLPECYKWYESEIARQSPLEYARRFGAKAIFSQEVLTEVRHGNRCALIADIQLPTMETITVVSTHLEDRCYPSCRFTQAMVLFENLKNIRNPVVIAGDFNTTTTDSAPTSFKKEIVKRIKDPAFIARQIAFIALPGVPVAGSFAAVGLSRLFQYKDPAYPNIPIFLPNQERKLFKYIKNFRFIDGERIDIRGEAKKSSNGKNGLLANSNERQLKGFESTFKFEDPRLIAYFKLDWFFVKPKRGRFEPFNGQTLQLINHAYPERISDHEPILVNLSL